MQLPGATHRNIYVRSERAGRRVMESVTCFITHALKLKVNEIEERGGAASGTQVSGLQLHWRSRSRSAHCAQGTDRCKRKNTRDHEADKGSQYGDRR